MKSKVNGRQTVSYQIKTVVPHSQVYGAVESPWSRTVGRAARLLFWTVLASVLFANVLGFVVPLITQSADGMKWIAFIPAVASIVIAVAAFGITACDSEPVQGDRPGTLRTPVRVAAVLSALVRCGATVPTLTVDVTETLPVALLHEVVIFLFQCMLFAYLSGLARSYGDPSLARWLAAVVWAYAVAAVGSVLVRVGTSLWDVPFDIELHLWNGLTLVVLAIEVLALVGLWRFGTTFLRAAYGRCVKCGYLLRGLGDHYRCPECGKAFDERLTR